MLDFLSNVQKVEALTVADIELLIANKVAENRQLDYKLKLSLDDKAKAEFLKDISSFYNSQGGVIIYGLQENKLEEGNAAVPMLPKMSGLEIENLDDIKLDISSCLRTGTNPAINTVYFSELLNVSGHQVLAIGIPKNNSLPAMVLKNVHSFYRRSQTQKYTMDTVELYNAFLKHSSERREVEQFVEQRREEIYEPHFEMRRFEPSVILHLIHTDYFQNVSLDTFFAPDFKEFATEHFKSTAYDVSHQSGYDFDGLYLLAKAKKSPFQQYLDGSLIFRNGIVEGLITTVFSEGKSSAAYSGALYVEQLLDRIIRYIKGAQAYYQRAGISPGFYLALSIHTPGRVSVVGPNGVVGGDIQKDVLKFPVFLLTMPSEAANVLGLILDILYQAAGTDQAPEKLKEKIKEHF